jgi:hypothetical protein
LLKEIQMAETQRSLRVGLSALIGLAIDSGLDRSVIAGELRHAADLVAPKEGVSFALEREHMSIDRDDRGSG